MAVGEVMKKVDFESFHILSGDIDEHNVESAIRWIIESNIKKIEKPIALYINSDGGNLNDAFGLTDMIRTSKTPVATIALGNLMSSAFLIFISGKQGYRGVAKNTSIMSHQFNHEFTGKYHDMKAYSKEIDRINQRMIDLVSDCSYDTLTKNDAKKFIVTPTDSWLTPDDLIYYNLADYIF